MSNMLVVKIETAEGKTVSVNTLPTKDFKTGSKGYFVSGKVEVDGVRYQMQVQLVAIGSKAGRLGEG